MLCEPPAMRALVTMAAAVVLLALVATLGWDIATIATRPLDGVEGDVLFEASRVRSGLPLWVDPSVGARDYGAVPARYYVLYPPLWSALLSLVPAGAAPLVARVVAAAAWLGVLVVAAASGSSLEARRVALLLAAFAAGAWVLSFYGMSGRPDAPAVALAGIALLRSARRGRVDALAGALFALAAWVKPNVVGAFPGAMVGTCALAFAARRRLADALRAAVPGIAGAAAVTIAAALVLTLLSGRTWLVHLLASTGQPPSLALWTEQLASRAPFFAAPLAVALVVGLARRRTVASYALVTSLAWCVLSLAKIGSAANYFLEPFVVAVVVVAQLDLATRAVRPSVLAGVALVVQALWTGVASVRSSFEHVGLARERAAFLAKTRRTCTGIVMADEPGLELALNGRIVATPFQSTHLARRGAFPLEAWLEDVSRPEIACLVMQDDLLERPLTTVSLEHDRFGTELRVALRAHFVHVLERGRFHLYRRVP